MRKPKLYLAAPLFSEAERLFNSQLKTILLSWYDVYLPQEDGFLITDLLAEGFTADAAKAEIFKRDVSEVRACDVLLIVMDGRSIDEGASFELGLAFALGKKCVGLQTDFRRLASFGNNPMIDCALMHLFLTTNALFEWAAHESGAEKNFIATSLSNVAGSRHASLVV